MDDISSRRGQNSIVLMLSSLASGQSIGAILPMFISVIAMDMTLDLYTIIVLVGIILAVRYFSKRQDSDANPFKTVLSFLKRVWANDMYEIKYGTSSQTHSYKMVPIARYIDHVILDVKKPFKCFIVAELANVYVYTFPDSNNQVEIQPGIYVSYEYEKVVEQPKKDRAVTTHSLQIAIRSKDKTKIDDFIKAADAFEKNSHKVQTIFESSVEYNDSGDVLHSGVTVLSLMRSSKTFDTLFFEGKERLIHHLDRFTNQKQEYLRLGMPHSLGMLFHGSPGTGKTSTIKAIANYTKRHLVIIKEIPDLESLRNFFGLDHLVSTRMYVFEEIDAGDLGEAFKPRSVTTGKDDSKGLQQNSSDATAVAMAAIASSLSPKDVAKSHKPKPKITLAEFLEFLDGIIEMPGRMIIFTTNHPEKLDPALLRPGRVDLVMEFKKMRRSDVSSMYELWFREPLPDTVKQNLKDYVFSQAEIGELFSCGDKTIIHNRLSEKV